MPNKLPLNLRVAYILKERFEVGDFENLNKEDKDTLEYFIHKTIIMEEPVDWA